MATDAERIAALNAAQDRVADDAEPLIAKILLNALNRVVDRYEATGNPLPPDELRQSIADALRLVWRESIIAGGRTVVDQFKDGFPDLERKEDEESFWDQILAIYTEQYGSEKITQIFEATREQIRRVIAKGQKDGLGVAAIASRMREVVPELSTLRAHVIARTETHSAALFSTQATAKASRAPLVKRWVSVADSRTRSIVEGDRYDHAIMDGVEVDLNDPFMVPKKDGTTEALSFPGDPAGSAGNVIMCRCAQVFRRKRYQ